MQEEHVPFTLKQLAINGNDLLALGIEAKQIATLLQKLLDHTAVHPQDNKKERLLRIALSFLK